MADSNRELEFGAGFSLKDDGSTKTVNARIAEAKQAVLDLAAALDRGEIAVPEFNAQYKQLASTIGALEKANRALTQAEQEQAAAMQRASAAAVDASAKTKRATGDMGAARQGALDVSRAVQDFTQGGLGGILNNLEGLGRAIPAILANPMALISSIPGMLTLVGVALFTFGGRIKDAFMHLVDGSNEIPAVADNLKRLDGRLKEVTEQLDKYREKQNLTNTELADYNRLSAEQLALEERKAKAIQEQTELKALKAKESPTEEDREKAQKAIVGDVIGGKQNDVAGEMASVMSDQARQSMFGDRRILEGQIASSAPGLNRNALIKQLGALNKQIQASLRGELFPQFKASAEKTLAKALAGDEAALNDTLRVMAQGGRFEVGGDLEITRIGLETATAKGQKKTRDEKHDIEQQAKNAKEQKEKAKEEQKARFEELASAERQETEEMERADARDTAQEKAKEKAAKKTADERERAEKKAADLAEREADRRNEAEARRIKTENPHAANIFTAAARANPLEDPQQLAAQVAAQMVQLLKQDKRWTQGGAQTFAQHAAAEAGFALTLPEIHAAGGFRSVSATPGADRPVLGAATAAGHMGILPAPDIGAIRAARAALSPAAGDGRQRRTIQPRRKRRGPKRTNFGATALARPPGALKAQAKIQQAAIAAQDRAKAARTAATAANVRSAVASQDAARDARTGATAQAIQAARAAQAARQEAAQASQRKTLQSAGYPAGPDATPAVATTQQAVSATQGAVAQSLANIAKVNADAQRLLQEASRIRKQAQDQGTALKTGNRQ